MANKNKRRNRAYAFGSSISVILLGLISGYIPDVFPSTLVPEIRIVSGIAFLVVAVLFILFEIQIKSEDENEFSHGQSVGKNSQLFYVCARYSKKERAWVKNLLKGRLKKAGMNARVVFALPLFDFAYARNCTRILQSGRVLLFVLTRRSFGVAFWKRFDFLIRKMSCSSGLDKKILVLRIEKCRVPKTLRANKVIDLFSDGDQESRWLTILQIIRNMQSNQKSKKEVGESTAISAEGTTSPEGKLRIATPGVEQKSYSLNVIAELDKIYFRWLEKYPVDEVLNPDNFLLETHPKIFLKCVVDDMDDGEIHQIMDEYSSKLRERFGDQI